MGNSKGYMNSMLCRYGETDFASCAWVECLVELALVLGIRSKLHLQY
jgi:hypothetical protein